MNTFKIRFVEFLSYFFILLFCYAAISKLLDLENFQIQLAQSPILSAYAESISYGVIFLEFIICLFLFFPKTRFIGLCTSFTLMVGFTVYIYIILTYSDFIPCSCGGILEKLGWTEHLIFNIMCVVFAGFGISILENTTVKKWQKTTILLSILTIFGTVAMVCLFISSEHLMKKENNFTRRFPHHPITEEKSFDLGVNSFYFIGIDNGNVYLGNSSSPFRIFKLEHQFQKIDTINLNPGTNFIFKNLKYSLHSKILYAYDGSVPVIYATSLDSISKPLSVRSNKDVYFDQLIAINKSEYFMRIEDYASKRLGIAFLSKESNTEVKVNSSLLTQKADGGFDADGKLLFDNALGNVYYMFFYRNQILKLNKNLEVTAKMRTIDPFSEAQLKVKTLKDGRTKMNQPSLLVNRNMMVHKGLIFNEANLIGKHESKDLWKKNAVVDVYTTTPAEYWGSFYVQHRGENKMSQMIMADDYFYILSGNEIVRYRCAQTLTKNFIKGSSRKPYSE